MWIFGRGLDDLGREDLDHLVNAHVRESVTLEYKRDMYAGADADIREMLRDVSSMANAEGGALIIGMDEDPAEGTARGLVNVPRVDVEAERLVGSCLANLSERIPGLRARPVPVGAGSVVVVRIPRSYRKPHMITFRGATEFWIRHDRQKSRMSIAEIRAAVTVTEDAEMKIQAFLDRRIGSRRSQAAAAIFASPILLEDGRVDAVTDARLHELIRNPPAYRPSGGVELFHRSGNIYPTLRGIAGVVDGLRELEVFRNGHVESAVLRQDLLAEQRDGGTLLQSWAIAEYIRNFAHLLSALRGITQIADPYAITLAVFNCMNLRMSEAGLDMWGRGRVERWTEGQDLVVGPIVAAADETPDRTAQRLADRLWNAFHFARCSFFDAQGAFVIPRR